MATRAERSGRRVRAADVPVIMAMVGRGDRRHDIAAWFGLNQGRIAEVEEGKYGNPPLAIGAALPPEGSPGPKALALRGTVAKVIAALEDPAADCAAALRSLKAAAARFDERE